MSEFSDTSKDKPTMQRAGLQAIAADRLKHGRSTRQTFRQPWPGAEFTDPNGKYMTEDAEIIQEAE